MFDIVGKRLWYFLISGVASLIAIVALATFGLTPGIQFSSGSIVTLRFEQKVDPIELQQELTSLGFSGAIVQTTATGDYFIRTRELTGTERTTLESALQAKFGALTETEFNSVSPMVASETVRNAAIAVAVSAIGILLYLTWAFRKMPNPLRYGSCAIVTLLHDVLIAVGVFSILGAVLGWEVDLMVITAILAIVGYSVNNNCVVFDRIRENWLKGMSADFEIVVNNSLVQTLGRCLNTNLTTAFALLALLLFVGASIQNFAVVFLAGLIAGTFSSTFVAPALLVVWEKGTWGRLLGPAGAKAKEA